MKVLVTGAGGFIGSHLVDRLKKDGCNVIGLDKKKPSEWTMGQRPDFFLPNVDVSKSNSLFSLHAVDLCFHLAADSRIQPSFKRPIDYVENNVLGTAQVLEFARSRKIPVIFAGSSTADAPISLNVYATTKFVGEQLCYTWSNCFGIWTAIARFYNVYGPRQIEEGEYATVVGIFEKQWREGKKLTITGRGLQRRDFAHVDDIVDGLVKIFERGKRNGEVFSLGSGRDYSVLEIARMFGTGDDEIKFIPRPRGEAENTKAPLAAARSLGWEPKWDLKDYIKGIVEKGRD